MKRPDHEAGFVRARLEPDLPSDDAPRVAVRGRRRIVLVAAAVVAVATGATVATLQLRRDTPAKQIARAEAFSARNEHRSAVIEYKRALQAEPQRPEARYLLGRELATLQDFQGAQIEFEKALAGGYPREKVLVPLVSSLLQQQQYPRVVALADGATLESPEAVAHLKVMLGTAWLETGRTQAGLAAYAAAKELVLDFPAASIAQARYLMKTGEFVAANALLATIPADDRHPVELLTVRGDIAFAQQKPREAALAYEAALKLAPFAMATRLNLAQAYVELKDFDHAKAQIRIVEQAAPRSAKAQFVGALAAYLSNDVPAARQAIARAVQLASSDGDTQLLAGAIALRADDLVDAEAHLAEAVHRMPANLKARQMLAELYLQRREPAKAEAVFEPVVATYPADQEIGTIAARIAMQRGDLAGASRVFDRLGILQTHDPHASLVSASLRFAAGNVAAGFAQLQAAAKASPDEPAIDDALVTRHLQQRQTDAATSAWQRLAKKQPDRPRTWELQALIALARNDPDAARRAMDQALALDPQYFPAVTGLAGLDLRQRRPDAARQRLRAFIAASPRPTDALLLLARIEGTQGTPETVLDLLVRARDGAPTSTRAVMDLAAFHAKRNDVAAELEAVRQGLAFAPNDQAFLAMAGDLLQRAGKPQEALAYYVRLAAQNDEDPDIAVRLGLARLATGNPEAARAAFRKVVKEAPARVDLQMKMVSGFLEVDDPGNASGMLADIAQLAPRSAMLVEYGGDVHVASKRLPEGIAEYRKAMARTPNSKLAIKLARALDLAQQGGEAGSLLAAWVKAHPRDELVLAFDARRSLVARDYARAASGYRRLAEAHPGEPVFANNLAWALAETGDPQMRVHAERAVSLAPADADAVDTLGWILVRQGDVAKGIETLERASALAPGKVDVRLHLAKALIRGGRKDAARSTLQAVIGAAPESPEARESHALLATL